ncbi:exonuclease : DNA polymerase III epsilon subunit-like 3'-5' exonuclease OS=Cyanobium gracile (strain ATCC 27147 / PCC 6307) GN=Cyagr_1089 PE=4 SV=1: RNase_T [Gemmataceae bacterium]|nr:exonuclease : DNA polymerase III epsilon subunit-like 3'-5' exonuclease OS=Cyanobium gracile (strain ATCC 27147 / PCC 6307) GN=Cyagr_1089 PE=4 SV=1: RNase_T [Gemmataceae bacterium]VTT99171.1 exonuclease : DNA polymerase III epsilon subunit-like 3'-5' exonuclease OS=Cyanobium gracile (strain ATCC 27147 / PCC 6307) GN=Cyagr_1089 PE=4 SV=1: RNase_T [Gemmataceae bacterium]
MAPRRPPVPPPHPDAPFVAIDFETADNGADSACAVGLVRVEGRAIVAREKVLVRPPRERVLFSWLHGITWDMVKDAPAFCEAWQRLAPRLDGVEFLAAHNAPFDRRVLHACCEAGNVPPPPHPFVCTVQIARRHWGLKPNDLASVCRRLGIGLVHHDPLSDAEACARILLAATHPAKPVLASNPGERAKT